MSKQSTAETVSHIELGTRELRLSTGSIAKQAGGAVLVQYGDTVVLGTANMSKPLYDDGDFLPLLVDYEEKFYAAGKIKGSRFIKREGRPSEDATLTARLIDRSLRPLFPEAMINDIQVVLTVLSYDGENDPDIPAVIAASAALTISDVPWAGPVAAVRVGRINGKFIINPQLEEKENSDLDLLVVGTKDRLVMIEGSADEIEEETLLDALDEAQQSLGIITPAILELQQKVGKDKREPNLQVLAADNVKRVQELIEQSFAKALEAAQGKQAFTDAEQAALASVQEQLTDEEKTKISDQEIKHAIHEFRGEKARQRAFTSDTREGGRKLNEVRPIETQVGLLPRTHGSGLFQRGETQVLTLTTLGGPADVQWLDTMEVETKKRYIHHYNFPAFSVGENKPNRGPGRREIGHGALAERALVPVLPSKEDWPYTMLVVSEVLESNGSSSMASVCGSTLSLMDAGVPIKKPVAGISMGLFIDGQGDYKILTDIAGIEDDQGDMDLKVAGTNDGITALQMDIKVESISRDILSDALAQAKTARLFILAAMAETIATPNKELSPHAPRIETVRVDVEKIGDLIGPKGKHINEIIEQTGVDIDIEDDGLVSITSNDEQGMAQALEWVHNMTREIKAGEKFEGRVTRLMDFGAFVELTPGTDGLVHISQFRDERVDKINDVVKVGDVIPVIVTEIDDMGRINLSHKAAIGGRAGKKTPVQKNENAAKLSSSEPFKGPRPPK